MWPLRFGTPVALLLVLLAVAAFARWRRRLGGWLTLAAVACLAVAAARPQWATRRRRVARVYQLDASGSLFLDTQAALDGLRRSMGELSARDRVGLVVFGAEPAVALPLTEVRLLPERLDAPTDPPSPDASDLAAAIRLAARQLPDEGFDRQLVLLSDGRETRSDAAAEAARAADAGLRLLCVPVGPADVADARIVRLHAPSHARVGQPFRLLVEVASTALLETELVVARGDDPVARRTLALQPGGIRRLLATDRLDRPGHYAYSARLASADRCDANDSARAPVHAEGATRLLCLAAGESPLAALLANADGLDAAFANPRSTRVDREALADLDCIVLDNVPAADLPDAAQQALRHWVRDAAGGLIALGGPASFGPGGYLDTPVEQALPVLCDRPRPLALVVALDKSGSMAERSGDRAKIAYARDAVLGALRRLRPGDRFALLAFDARPDVRIPLGTRPETERARLALDGIVPHGGTDVEAALDRAVALLGSRTRTELRHVILVSDGQDRRFDPAALAARCTDAKVSLAVLMTGTAPDAVARLRALAPGDFHHVTDPAALPAIFRKALLKARFREQVRRGSFPLRTVRPELAAGIAPAGPLAGYVRVIAKPEATVEWATADGEPILARWRCGLGRAVAFASTVGTEWDRGLLDPADAARLWQQAVRWAARPARTPGFEAEVAHGEGRLAITVRAEADGRFRNGLRLAARVVPPEGQPTTVPLPQVAPGEYRGQAPADAQGIYAIAVAEDGQALRLSLRVARGYAREWEAFGVHRPTLDAVARNGRGQVIADLAALRLVRPRTAAAYADLDWAAVALALILFVAAVARHTLGSRSARL